MAKFFGKVGFGEQIETSPGVYTDVMTERPYYGDVIRNTRNMRNGEKLNDDISVSNSISIVASDDYVNEHIFAIRYVQWAGALWTVDNVEVQRPRLLLTLGEVWNGPRPETP